MGGNVFGWTVLDESTAFSILDGFVDAGFNFIDTADVYPMRGDKGTSERMIGNWLRHSGKRDRVVLATKGGNIFAPDKQGLGRDYLPRAVEASLQRLGTDRIDLYQSHKDDPETPVEETLETYAKLIREGKIRAIGASNFAPDRLFASHAAAAQKGIPGYTALQPLYNLHDRADFETRLLPAVQELNLGVLTYLSLAGGFLTGKYRSTDDLAQSARGKRVERYLDERGFRILDALHATAARLEASPAAVALAWLIGRPGVTSAIASATRVDQLKVFSEAVRLRLDGEALAQLDEASAGRSLTEAVFG